MIGLGGQFLQTVWQILAESAFWVVVSLVVGGVVHEFLPASRLKKLMNRKGNRSMLGAVLFGGCLPICSCGVIPLAVSLYKAGVSLGPVMAFTAATPIINPAAVLLSLALLGPQITLVYVALGLTLPFLLGAVSQRWGDRRSPSLGEPTQAEPGLPTAGPGTLLQRVLRSLRWGFLELGTSIGFYLGIGVLLAGVIATALPASALDAYLRENSEIALLAAGLLGASIYVCAVAHIPLVATLLATGAAPGVAVVFLVTGTATNLPELVALYNTIGRRTVILYSSTLIAGAIIAGFAVNAWLTPGFVPVFDPVRSLDLIDAGERLQLTVGGLASTAATVVLIGLAAVGTWQRVVARIRAHGRIPASGDSCCSE